ncbi:MAG: hypothetical protein WCD18_03980, partial [Thermosynechococcaceae cyanobacterium]
MLNSMKDMLEIALPYLSSDLVESEALFALKKTTQLLPNFSKAIGFECRLSENKQVDLFSLYRPVCNTLNFLSIHPIWKNLNYFCQEWYQTNSLINLAVNNIWLEFDLENTDISSFPLPSVFISFKRKFEGDIYNLLLYICRRLDYWISEEFKDFLNQLVRCLSKSTKIHHVGLMFSRSTGTIKLVLHESNNQKELEYLDYIGWYNSKSYFQDLVQELLQFVDYVRILSLDLDKNVCSAIGVECYLDEKMNKGLRWQQLLDHLVERKLCTP